MAEKETLILELEAKVKKFERDMARASKNSVRDMDRMQKKFNRLDSDISKFTSGTIRNMRNIAGVLGVALSGKEVIQYADAWNRVQNRLRTVTTSQKELASATEGVVRVAKDSWTDLDSTATLYQRIARSTKDMNLEQEKLLDLTSLINKGFQIAGATTQEASASVIQLSQSFSRGVLRGDEFRSVAEQAPVVMEAIMVATGSTRGELIKFAETGKLTTDVVIKSLLNYQTTIEDVFATTQKTISHSLTVASTDFTKFIGNLDDAVGFTKTFGENVTSMSGELDGLVDPIATGIDHLKTWIEEWENAFGADASSGVDAFVDNFQRQMMALQSFSKVTVEFIEDAFMQMPNNINAMAKIIGIEAASMQMKSKTLMGELESMGENAADLVSTLMDSVTGAATDEDVLGAFSKLMSPNEEDTEATMQVLEDLRIAAIGNVLAEREERQAAFEERLEQLQALREAGDPSVGGSDKSEIEDEEDKAGKIIDLTASTEKEKTKLKIKEEKFRSAIRRSVHKDTISIMNSLAGESKGAAMAVFLVDKALAANEVFVSGQAAQMRALAELGPIAGPPVVAAIKGKTMLSLAAIAASTVSGFPSGGGGGGGISGGGAGASITTNDGSDFGRQGDDSPQALSVSVGGSGGSSNITIMAPPGDEVAEMLAQWINTGLKRGRIGG